MANLHRFKGYYNTGHFFRPPPLPPHHHHHHLLFSFFISHSRALRLTPVSVDADIPRAFHNPFDVRLSAVMSLFKGFSVAGSALAGSFLEHTMPRSAPVAWDVFGGQQAALAPIRMLASGTGLHGGESCGPETRAPPLLANWEHHANHFWTLTTPPLHSLCRCLFRLIP